MCSIPSVEFNVNLRRTAARGRWLLSIGRRTRTKWSVLLRFCQWYHEASFTARVHTSYSPWAVVAWLYASMAVLSNATPIIIIIIVIIASCSIVLLVAILITTDSKNSKPCSERFWGTDDGARYPAPEGIYDRTQLDAKPSVLMELVVCWSRFPYETSWFSTDLLSEWVMISSPWLPRSAFELRMRSRRTS